MNNSSAASNEHSDAGLSELDRRVTKVETLVGEDSDTGLRGDLREMRKALRGLELRGYTAAGVAIAVIWAIEHAVK